MTRILVVCLGNICRSPLAHGILESKLPAERFFIDSAGTGNYHIGSPPDIRSIQVAQKYGIDISNQRCRQFQMSDFDVFDQIYVMDASNYNAVIQLARNSTDISKVKLIGENSALQTSVEIPDPYFGDQTDFEHVFHLLNDISETLSQELQTYK